MAVKGFKVKPLCSIPCHVVNVTQPKGPINPRAGPVSFANAERNSNANAAPGHRN